MPEPDDPEPRWPALVGLLAAAGLYAALPRALIIGPRWLLLTMVVVLLVPTVLAYRRGHHALNRVLGLIVAGIVTVGMVVSLALLIHALPRYAEAPGVPGGLTPQRLLRSAVSLWLTNVLVFALWYWHLDAGGPYQRDLRVRHAEGAFLFPQMTMSAETRAQAGQERWSPGFVDYLFLAFNTSTALSPADTAALSRWAKVLMMVQASISLAIVAFLAARAVNIL